MMEWTAAKILELVFGKVIETGAGKLTEGALDKGKQLLGKIREKLKGEPTAEAALAKVESDKAQADLAEVVPFLQVEMIKDKPFAQEIQTLAQEFHQEINISNSADAITMNVDARDNSVVVGKAEAQTQTFGGTHNHNSV
jgi:hypothetical protein